MSDQMRSLSREMDATIALAIQGVRADVASSLQVMQSALDTRSDTLLQQVEARLLAVPLSAPVQQRTPALAVQIADPRPLAPVPTPAPTHDPDRVEL
eukprot:2947566-Pyramimonas_sp.AAC.1